jgi:hypothetical protein
MKRKQVKENSPNKKKKEEIIDTISKFTNEKVSEEDEKLLKHKLLTK